MIICNNYLEAMQLACVILGGSTYKNEDKSAKAGYPIYDSDEGGWVSDLGGVIEVNHKDGNTTRIHLSDKMPTSEATISNLHKIMVNMPWREYKNLNSDGKVFYDHLYEELNKVVSK